MQINIDFEGAIAKALQPELLAPILDKAITRAIVDAVESATGYRSAFQETLKTQLAAAMPHGLALDDIAKFQHVLNGALQKLVQESNANAVNTALQRAMAHVMPDVPATVKLSELMKDVRGYLHIEPHEAFFAHLESTTYGYHHLSLDKSPRPGSSSYGSRESMKYAAAVRIDTTGDGEVYALKFQGQQITPNAMPSVIGHFDSILMSMYVGRTRLEIDLDDDDLQSMSAEQYD